MLIIFTSIMFMFAFGFLTVSINRLASTVKSTPKSRKSYMNLHYGGKTHDEIGINYLEGTQYKSHFLTSYNHITGKMENENPKMAGGNGGNPEYSLKIQNKIDELKNG